MSAGVTALTVTEAQHIVAKDGVSLVSRDPYMWDADTLCAIYVHVLGALSRAAAEKVITETQDEAGLAYEFVHHRCPNCRNIIAQERPDQKTGLYRPRYHQDCGQHLDWLETREGGAET